MSRRSATATCCWATRRRVARVVGPAAASAPAPSAPASAVVRRRRGMRGALADAAGSSDTIAKMLRAMEKKRAIAFRKYRVEKPREPVPGSRPLTSSCARHRWTRLPPMSERNG